MKRIVILADDPTLNTGYARVARFVANTLSSEYDVTYLPCNAMTAADRNFSFNLEEFDPRDPYWGSNLQSALIKYRPSLFMAFGDFPHVAYSGKVAKQVGVRSLYYFPIEGNNYPPKVVFLPGGFIEYHNLLNMFDTIVAYTQFGADNINKALPGIVKDIIPHQVDINTFRPLDRDAVFKNFFPTFDPEKTFICGYIGRNQQRKGIDCALSGFANFVHNYANCTKLNPVLFMVTDPQDPQGYHLYDLIDHYKLKGYVIIIPVTGGKDGPADNQMCEIINTFDLSLNLHRSEGWGLSSLESAASGTQVLTTNYAGPAEFGQGVFKFVDPVWYEPLPSTGTLQAVLNPNDIGSAINKVYQTFTGHNSNMLVRARAEQYSEEVIAKKWLTLLNDMRLQDTILPEAPKAINSNDELVNDYLGDIG